MDKKTKILSFATKYVNHITILKEVSKGVITRPNQVSQTFAETWVCETKLFSAVFVIGKGGGALVQ